MIRQRTIKNPVVIEGIGLQTGSKTKLTLKASPADGGINFIRVDLPGKPLLSIRSFSFDDALSKERRTTLVSGAARIETIEHLLAALSGLGIDNLTVEVCGAELPGLDGSADEYVKALDRAGIVEQDAPKPTLTVKEPIFCTRKDAFLSVFPHNGFRISYFLSYPVSSIGDQFLSLEISEDTFKRELAPARTFCMKKEAFLLKALGFGKGANSGNTLVMGRAGPVKNRLRFPDEPVRHKILDLIGDLYLTGMSLNAHLVAVKSGHRLNMELVKKLKVMYALNPRR